ncbi:MAG: multidrug efflux RND transporter permease subunit [Thiohalocapsa sp.]
MFVEFFIRRPIFATAIAILITLAGLVSIPVMPVDQYPDITPPTIQVTANYDGAGAKVVEQAVTQPIEEQVNGAEGMLYMSSSSNDDGSMTLTVTFDIGYDVDIAAVDVQNRTSVAQSQLPDEVVRSGVQTTKQAPFVTLCLDIISPDQRYDELYLNNYANIHIVNVLERIPGVGQVQLFGDHQYAMRIWLDPDRLAGFGLTASDVTDAITAQNKVAASGAVGAPPVPEGQAMRWSVTAKGRLSKPEEFGDIVLRAGSDGSLVRIKDVGRVEMGADTYGQYVKRDGQDAANICLFELPGGNSLDIAQRTYDTMARLANAFPDGVEYRINYDTTLFVRESIRELLITLAEATALVFLVIVVFLKSWRATLIPAITIPVSLIGTFALLNLLGFSINTLTLFGLVLAVGLVVDDAIVVVENVSRLIQEGTLSLREATRRAMDEVTGPIIATTLVLMAVFVPIAFMPGVTGQLYQQFALTIACAVGISALNALTLSPALCAVFLRRTATKGRLATAFDRGFEAMTAAYERGLGRLLKLWLLVLLVFGALIALTVYVFDELPRSFVPSEDQGFLIGNVQLPEGASLERTREVADAFAADIRAIPGVAHTLTFGGYSFVAQTSATNLASVIPIFAAWDQRTTPETQIGPITEHVRALFPKYPEASIVAFAPPSVHGLSQTGGFEFELQALTGGDLHTLANLSQRMVSEGNARPELTGLFSGFSADTPQLNVSIDRERAMAEGVALPDIFDTLQTQLGGLYVNDYNRFGRVFKVYVQSEGEYRNQQTDVGRLQVRNTDGDMTPLQSFATVEPVVGARTISHYNSFRSATINGNAASGYSSGQAISAMEELAEEVLPPGYGFEWSGLSFEQLQAGNQQALIFALGLICVFLFLAALYESWSMPFMIILAVPLAMLGGLSAQWLRGLDNDVYTQIGLIMLIGLASKNAILIVEFAKRLREQGHSIEQAALEAARVRLRPILMTAFAFILGVVPLVIATGAGANARHSLGTTVFGGMILSTLLSLVLVPVLFVLIERLRERRHLASGGEAAG